MNYTIKKITISILLALAALLPFWAGAETKTAHAQASSCTVGTNSNPPHSSFNVFSKHIDVFGLGIYAHADVPESKVIHTANVMRQYLDNNADGSPDNEAVVAAMVAQNASMIMFDDEGSAEEENFFDALPDGIEIQPLYGFETRPEGSGAAGFDATLEEVLHLITHVGYANVYPEVWGETSDSAVAKAMDVARGGHFESVPSSYPAEAWYHYDDTTCDYGCQVTEYVYWALTSILGAQEYAERPEEIAEEWELYNASLVQAQDATIYTLLTDPTYNFATTLPTGSCSEPIPTAVNVSQIEGTTGKSSNSFLLAGGLLLCTLLLLGYWRRRASFD